MAPPWHLRGHRRKKSDSSSSRGLLALFLQELQHGLVVLQAIVLQQERICVPTTPKGTV